MRNMAKISQFVFIFVLCLSFVSSCDDNQVDINSASAEELDELTGIGPVYAERIIEGRPYEFIDDLIDVNGIGEITLEKIKQQGLACVEDEDAEEDEDIEEIGEEGGAVIKDKTEEISEEDENEVILSNENIINLNSKEEIEKTEQTGRVIYESKNEEIKSKAIYFFAGFLILIIIALLIWR